MTLEYLVFRTKQAFIFIIHTQETSFVAQKLFVILNK